MWDHPRACGEKNLPPPLLLLLTGSPPRMRGKVNLAVYNIIIQGITPAHAGKSHGDVLQTVLLKDHPRACGEKLSSLLLKSMPEGSPPRMRGKGILMLRIKMQLRITPAHAGKSYTQVHRFRYTQDHPRACGEKPVAIFMLVIVAGSPPRMRGKVIK